MMVWDRVTPNADVRAYDLVRVEWPGGSVTGSAYGGDGYGVYVMATDEAGMSAEIYFPYDFGTWYRQRASFADRVAKLKRGTAIRVANYNYFKLLDGNLMDDMGERLSPSHAFPPDSEFIVLGV